MNHKHTLGVFAAGLILSAGLAASVAAQSGAVPTSSAPNPQREGRGEGRHRRPDLGLSADQRAQLKSMREGQREKIMALRNDKNLSQEQRMEKMRAIREGMRTQVQGILTPQQQERIKNARAEGRERGRARGRGPGHGGIGAMNFTAEQRTQLKSIHEGTRAQVDAVRNDSTLTQEQKFAKLQSIHQNTRQQMSGILTAEQQQKMKEGRHDGRRGPGRFGGPRGRRGGPTGTESAQPTAKPYDQ